MTSDRGIDLRILPFGDPKNAQPMLAPFRINPLGLEEVGGTGKGSFELSRSDAALLADSNLLDDGNIVRFYADGEVSSAFIIDEVLDTLVGKGENQEQGKKVMGEGLKSWFNNATVRPSGNQRTKYDTREFSFASERGTWYKDADWKTPATVEGYLTQNGIWGTAPSDWPDAPYAAWIWDRYNGYPPVQQAPVGYVYFRHEFSTTVARQHSVFISVDDAFDLYIDGQRVVEASPDETWPGTTRVNFDLQPGQHVLAVRARNLGGPAGMICALFEYGDPNVPSSANLLMHSGQIEKWKVNAYPVQEPGWTPGEILLKLLAEAQSRGVKFPNFLTPTFTATTDSKGQPWGAALPWSFKLGMKYLRVVEMLEELVCDIWIDPKDFKLYASKTRGTDRSIQTVTQEPVILRIGKNTDKASEQKRASRTNSLYVETEDGWVERKIDSSATSPYGVIEDTLSTGRSESTSAEIIAATFAQLANPEVSVTITIVPVLGAIPLKDFFPGDWILAPSASGLVRRRVMSIATEEDEAGLTQYSIELDSIFQDRATMIERQLEILRNGRGATGSGANTSTPGGSSAVVRPTPADATNTRTPRAPTNIKATTDAYWTQDGYPSSSITVTWDGVTTATDGTQITPTSYEIWARRIGATDSILLTSVEGTIAVLTNYVPGQEWEFKVRARTVAGKYSNFGTPASVTAATPSTPLDPPTTPIVTQKLGVIQVTWDGKLTSVGPVSPPPQFNSVYVAMSSTETGQYTPVGQTLIKQGSASIGGLNAGDTRWFRLYAVDNRGVTSTPSPAVSVLVGSFDIIADDKALQDRLKALEAALEDAKTDAANALGSAGNALAASNYARTTADQAAAAAQTAAGLTAGQGKVIFQVSAPTGANAVAQNLWIRTGDNQPYKYDTTLAKWVAVTAPTALAAADRAADTNTTAINAKAAADKAATDAAAAAAETERIAKAAAEAAAAKADQALTAANGKNTVFYSASAPTANRANDIWYDSDEGNRPYRWTGTEWVLVNDTKTAQDAANSKTKNTWSTNAPTGTNFQPGDAWYRVDGQGTIIAQWQFSNGAWASRPMGGAAIAADSVTAREMKAGTITADSGIIGSLDAGVITAGTLSADRIGANSITATKIAAGAISSEQIAVGAKIPSGDPNQRVPARVTDFMYWNVGPTVGGSGGTIPGSPVPTGPLAASKLIMQRSASFGPFSALVLGDSMLEGTGQTAISKRIQDIVAARLGALVEAPGSQVYVPAFYEFARNAPNQIPLNAGATWTGTYAISTAHGLGRRAMTMNASATATLTRTASSIDVRMTMATSDVITIQWDDGAVQTYGPGLTGLQRLVNPAGTGAVQSRTVVVSRTAGAPVLRGWGAFQLNEGRGVRFFDSAKHGTLAYQFNNVRDSNGLGWQASLSEQGISMAILEHVTNDAKSGTETADMWYDAMKTNIGILRTRAGNGNLPILIFFPWEPANLAVGVWETFRAKARQLVSEDSFIQFADFSTVITSEDQKSGLLAQGDAIHWNDAGAAQAAEFLYNVLSENGTLVKYAAPSSGSGTGFSRGPLWEHVPAAYAESLRTYSAQGLTLTPSATQTANAHVTTKLPVPLSRRIYGEFTADKVPARVYNQAKNPQGRKTYSPATRLQNDAWNPSSTYVSGIQDQTLERNYLRNPRMYLDTSYWAADANNSSIERVTSGPEGREIFARFTKTAAATSLFRGGVALGNFSLPGAFRFVVSFDVRVAVPSAWPTTMLVSLETNTGYVNGSFARPTTTWQRMRVIVTGNSNSTVYNNVYLEASGVAPGAVLETTNWRVSPAYTNDVRDSEYFDGDTPSTDGYNYSWQESANGREAYKQVTWSTGFSQVGPAQQISRRIPRDGFDGGAFTRAEWTQTPTPSGNTSMGYGGVEYLHGTVKAGVTHTMSAYVRTNKTRVINLVRVWRTNAGNEIASGVAGTATVVADTWTRIQMSPVPGNAGAGQVIIRAVAAEGSAAVAVGDWIDMDGVTIMTLNPGIYPYFDGDTPSLTGMTYRWDGTPYFSNSLAVSAAPFSWIHSLGGGQGIFYRDQLVLDDGSVGFAPTVLLGTAAAVGVGITQFDIPITGGVDYFYAADVMVSHPVKVYLIAGPSTKNVASYLVDIPANTWTRLSMRLTADMNVTASRLTARVYSEVPAGFKFQMTRVLVSSDGAALTTYIDGVNGTSTGEVDNSPSYKYSSGLLVLTWNALGVVSLWGGMTVNKNVRLPSDAVFYSVFVRQYQGTEQITYSDIRVFEVIGKGKGPTGMQGIEISPGGVRLQRDNGVVGLEMSDAGIIGRSADGSYETIRLDAVDGSVAITGGTIRTSSEMARSEMTPQGFRTLDGSGSELIKLGYGIETGMAVRDPYTKAMVPLGPQVFGTRGVTQQEVILTDQPANEGSQSSQKSAYVGNFISPTGRFLVMMTVAASGTETGNLNINTAWYGPSGSDDAASTRFFRTSSYTPTTVTRVYDMVPNTTYRISWYWTSWRAVGTSRAPDMGERTLIIMPI